jgi:hypothetical protein
VVLDAGGEPTFMGRSGKSSHHQLSTNKLISRVHIQAVYIPANPPKYAKVQVECTGWNGAKIHCQGRAWELAKGDSFTSDKPDADIMIDVQDARVLLKWPKVKMQSLLESDSDETSENSPRRGVMNARSPFSSPLKERARLRSPVSPSPIRQRTTQPSLLDTGSSLVLPAVQIYEDDPSENEAPAPATTQLTQSTQHLTQPLGARQGDGSKLGSPLAHDVNDYYGEDDENENGSNENEENDPIIDSFYGENSIQSRMASFNTNASPLPNARSVLGEKSPQNAHLKVESTIGEKSSRAITNHVINQLAYSRLSSTPLSDIMKNLPSELKDVISSGSTKTSRLSTSSLKYLLHKTACVGEVQREGKDAAGKALESEFYYIPDADEDHERRDTVVDSLRKPGLRACRKQHKVRSTIFGIMDQLANKRAAILLAQAEMSHSVETLQLERDSWYAKK